LLARNMGENLRISVRSPFNHDVLIGFLIDWLFAVLAQQYLWHK